VTDAPAPARGRRKTLVGHVVSNKMEKTAVVQVRTTRPHPLYNKAVRREKKYYAHDDSNTCRIGDLVRIAEARPTSKLKRWRVVEVIERSRE